MAWILCVMGLLFVCQLAKSFNTFLCMTLHDVTLRLVSLLNFVVVLVLDVVSSLKSSDFSITVSFVCSVFALRTYQVFLVGNSR